VPFVIKPGQDEWATLTSGRALSHGDPQEATRLIADAWVKTKGILDERQDGVANIAAALVERNFLDTEAIVNILGPLPSPRFDPGVSSENADFDETFFDRCMSTMMKDRPFAVAQIESTPPQLGWCGSDRVLRRVDPMEPR